MRRSAKPKKTSSTCRDYNERQGTRVEPVRPMETRVSMEDPILFHVKQFTFTSGREVYPYRGGSFEVGPLTIEVSVLDPDNLEALKRAFGHARELLETLMEAEFALKRHAYDSRLKEVRGV